MFALSSMWFYHSLEGGWFFPTTTIALIYSYIVSERFTIRSKRWVLHLISPSLPPQSFYVDIRFWNTFDISFRSSIFIFISLTMNQHYVTFYNLPVETLLLIKWLKCITIYFDKLKINIIENETCMKKLK